MRNDNFLSKVVFVAILFFSGWTMEAQQVAPLDQTFRYLEQHLTDLELTQADLQSPVVTDNYQSKHNGVTHIYMRQTHNNIEVLGGIINANIAKDGKVISLGNRFVSDLANRVNANSASLSVVQAVNAAAHHLDLTPTGLSIEDSSNEREYTVSNGGISNTSIPVKMMYLPVKEGMAKLIWQVVIYTNDYQHHWFVNVDAVTGEILSKRDQVIHCDFGAPNIEESGEIASLRDRFAERGEKHVCTSTHQHINTSTQQNSANPDSYNVYPLGVEAPIYGGRQLVTNPADLTASPYGWHDIDAAAGAEFTITRGNNVYAQEDVNGNDGFGYSPDGGANLDFDFPLDFTLGPTGYQDAAITNLFYWNNIMHDVWYRYGFDEISGNYQENNYGNGGEEHDFVIADAQDGGGTNNANFNPQADGTSGRMQMYLWTGGGTTEFNVNSPSGIAGMYSALTAAFGPGNFNVTGDLVLVDDGSATPTELCDPPLNNAADVAGNIAVIDRGNCEFGAKVLEAENAGAIAAVVCNNVAGAPISMGAGAVGNTVTIPSMMISQADCATIRAQLPGVNLTMTSISNDLDGDLDNGIVAHEYGHGISTRLTGGPNNSGCLGNNEQQGEGWSDWFGLVLTIETGDQGSDARGIGNYATGAGVNGGGIRPWPYSTDMGVNPHTYGDVPNEAIPHGVGSVWCAMIWDMHWALIDLYGYDNDLYEGTGGNNISMQLVMDGMKLQPCSPEFPEARDAILEADMINYNGANECLIWEVFARRGLGYSATAGGNEAFDIAPSCITPTEAPDVDFEANTTESCDGEVLFTDISANYPNSWDWDFGDGNTSNLQNPSHQYAADGTYTVTLTASNVIGASTETKTAYVVVEFLAAPSLTGGMTTVCSGTNTTLTASADDVAYWLDGNGNVLGTGNVFATPNLTSSTTFYLENRQSPPIENVGPVDNSFAGGGYHNTGFRGTVDFEAFAPFTILSIWIDAGSAGNRQIDLEENGTVIASVNVAVVAGPQRVDLDLEVPASGNYSLAGESIDMFRNDSGANYPYTINGLVSLTGSSAGADYYYYFYDWEVQAPGCASEQIPVAITVEICDNINDTELAEVFHIQPNPNDGSFNIELEGEAHQEIEIAVLDILGQVVFQQDYEFNTGQLTTRIDLDNAASGTYFVQVSAADQVSYQKVVVK